jgi:hypothetical protein
MLDALFILLGNNQLCGSFSSGARVVHEGFYAAKKGHAGLGVRAELIRILP